jgi:hypothetical protein
LRFLIHCKRHLSDKRTTRLLLVRLIPHQYINVLLLARDLNDSLDKRDLAKVEDVISLRWASSSSSASASMSEHDPSNASRWGHERAPQRGCLKLGGRQRCLIGRNVCVDPSRRHELRRTLGPNNTASVAVTKSFRLSLLEGGMGAASMILHSSPNITPQTKIISYRHRSSEKQNVTADRGWWRRWPTRLTKEVTDEMRWCSEKSCDITTAAALMGCNWWCIDDGGAVETNSISRLSDDGD